MQNQERGQDKEVGAAILRRGSEKASFLGGGWGVGGGKVGGDIMSRGSLKCGSRSSKGVTGVLWSRQGSVPQKAQHKGL